MGRRPGRSLEKKPTPKARKPVVEEYVAERIVGQRKLGRVTQYKVKWTGWPKSESTWENESVLGDAAKTFIDAFRKKEKREQRESTPESDDDFIKLEPKSTSRKRERSSQRIQEIENKRKGATKNRTDPSSVADSQLGNNVKSKWGSAAAAPDEDGKVRPRRSARRPAAVTAHVSENSAGSSLDSDNLNLSNEAEPPACDESKVERILGMNDSTGENCFLVRFTNKEERLVPSKEANAKWPQVVIKFYENHIVWKKD